MSSLSHNNKWKSLNLRHNPLDRNLPRLQFQKRLLPWGRRDQTKIPSKSHKQRLITAEMLHHSREKTFGNHSHKKSEQKKKKLDLEMIKFANLSVKYQITREYLASILQHRVEVDKPKLRREGVKGKFLSYAFLHSHRILFKFCLSCLRRPLLPRLQYRVEAKNSYVRVQSSENGEGRERNGFCFNGDFFPSELCLFFAKLSFFSVCLW